MLLPQLPIALDLQAPRFHLQVRSELQELLMLGPTLLRPSDWQPQAVEILHHSLQRIQLINRFLEILSSRQRPIIVLEIPPTLI